MPIAYWCVLVAGLMPLVAAGIAKAGANVDNRLPRDAVLSGYRQRANAAHFNSYEAFPLFAAAVVIAVTQHAPTTAVNVLAVMYVIARAGYIACYVADQDRFRSLIFVLALLVNIAIFVLPVFA